jgi:hypothetical protein
VKHYDVFGRELHVGQPVAAAGPVVSGHVWALGHATSRESIVMLVDESEDLSRHLAAAVMSLRRIPR